MKPSGMEVLPMNSKSQPSNLTVSYAGYFTPFSGYGIANINWVKHLKRLGVVVSVQPKFEPKPGSPEWEILNEEEREMFGKPYEVHKLGIIESNPFDFENLTTEVKIASTMCESDHLAPVWADKLNAMDYIIVPNEFCKKVFIDSGVVRPIKIIPHGVDTERFSYYERPKRDTFTFGIVGYLDQVDRKGGLDLMRAFSSEFDEEENVRLVLKSSDPLFGYYNRFTDPRIRVITKNYSFPEMNELYRSFDCFVFPSKAEGVGYPPREAMATGLPTIVTNWSGLEDIALPDVSYPVAPAQQKKRPVFIEQDGNWAIPDISEIMYLMRQVYENQDEAREKGKRASQFISSNFSWEKCAQELKDFLCTVMIERNI